MPFTFSLFSSFPRSLKKLGPEQRRTIAGILEALAVYLNTGGNLSEAQKICSHFFFKKLRMPYYEAGIENRLRVVLEKQGGDFYAVFAGNHDDIRRFLARS
jgi:hypothetical protein